MLTVDVMLFLFQCVQKPNQQLQFPTTGESVDSKDNKLQEQDQKQPAQTPDSCPTARRAKRMKCEVGVAQESRHASQSGLVTYVTHRSPF